jgi:hypothetical protein
MRRHLAAATIAALISLCAMPPGGAGAATILSVRTAKHALRVNLARGYGIHDVSATCKRRSHVKFSCRWTGRRSGRSYRGRAVVARAGQSTTVHLTDVHRG